jgi:hypothetical protein
VHLQQQQVVQPQLQQPRGSHGNSSLLLNQAAMVPSLDGAYREPQRGVNAYREIVGALPLAGNGIVSMGGDGLGRHIINRACGYGSRDQQCPKNFNKIPNQGWDSKSGHLKYYDVGVGGLSGMERASAVKVRDDVARRMNRSFSGNDLGEVLQCQSHGNRHSARGGLKGLSSMVGGFGENRSYQNSGGDGDDGEHLHRHLVISNPNSEDDDN